MLAISKDISNLKSSVCNLHHQSMLKLKMSPLPSDKIQHFPNAKESYVLARNANTAALYSVTSADLRARVLATETGGRHPNTWPSPTDVGYGGEYGQSTGFICKCKVCFSTERFSASVHQTPSEFTRT